MLYSKSFHMKGDYGFQLITHSVYDNEVAQRIPKLLITLSVDVLTDKQ